MNITQEPWFRWMPGMLTTNGGDGDIDTNDPATIGCLTALMRELTDDPCAHVYPHDDPAGDTWWTYVVDLRGMG